MATPLMLTYYGACAIAIGSGMFGVGLARMIWADDLKHAQRIDEIRIRTEKSLRGTIESLEQQLAIYRK